MGRLSKMWFGRRCSLFRKLGVAAAAARDAVRVLRQEDPSPALRTVLPFPGDPSPIDLVEFSLEPGGALLLLRLCHHLASFFLGSAFFSGFFSSFFSSFLSAGFFSSLGGAFSGFASGFASGLASAFASAFGPSAFGGAAFSALGVGVGFSGFGAAFSLTSGSISLFRTRMCFRSTESAS